MNAKELLPLLRLHGRTVFDGEKQALFFNWTCAGFTVRFRGASLRARLTAVGDAAPSFPGMPPLPPVFPYLGVATDGAEALERCQVLDSGDAWVTLFASPAAGEHTLRLVKLSEGGRGKLGLLELETDGELLPPLPEQAKPRIEFVGDSITCGLGNKTTDGSFTVRPDEEDGWLSYAALCARELDCEWSIIAESGIEVSRPEKPFFEKHGMDEIYAFTDELYDSLRGAVPEKWDFAARPNDIVVVNLGTNDGNTIRFYPALGQSIDDVPRLEARFERQYGRFLAQLRQLNGPDTLIVCTLGTMDYALWGQIVAAAERYKAETGDEKLILFRFVGINGMMEGYGAGGHPSLKTHARMARELAHILRPLLPR